MGGSEGDEKEIETGGDGQWKGEAEGGGREMQGDGHHILMGTEGYKRSGLQ